MWQSCALLWSVRYSTLRVSSYPCPQIPWWVWLKVTSTPAYYGMKIITAVTSLVITAVWCRSKTFFSKMVLNKLVCLSLWTFFNRGCIHKTLFSSQLTNRPNKLDHFIKLGYKGGRNKQSNFLGLFVSYDENEVLWIRSLESN